MELRKFARKPIEFRRDWAYTQQSPGMYVKPVGFWVSVEGERDWKSWCLEESFDIGLDYEHKVELEENANILRISSLEELEAFDNKYKIVSNHSWEFQRYAIDWHQVVEDYSGIIIAPYQYEARWGMDWYYTWDVASGCIWDNSAIKSVELIKEKVNN